MSTDVKLSTRLNTIRSIGPIVGVAGLVAGGVLSLLFGMHFFFEAFLYSFWILMGISMGSLAFIMIHHMTAGAWSFVSQRIFEAFTRTLIVPFIGFAVVILAGTIFGFHDLYVKWADPEQHSHIVGNKALFLNVEFWSFRSVFYFAVWALIIFKFNDWSRKLEETGDALLTLKFRFWAPVGLITYCLTMTFAAADWGMSLEPEWFSTMYAPLTWISQGLTVLAITILVLSSLAEEKPLSRYITVEHYHTLATLMCGFVVLWAYMSFSQFLIIWAGNLPEEIPYYLTRSEGGYYSFIVFVLMVGHFFFPLLVLLQRKIKYNMGRLRMVCYWMIGMRLVDVFFQINPAFHYGDPAFPIKDILVHVCVFTGCAGFYFWYFAGQLKKMPLLPTNDPRLYKAVGHGEEALDHA